MQRLGRVLVGTAATALWWCANGRELLLRFDYGGSRAEKKPYVGLHTPDSDALPLRAIH